MGFYTMQFRSKDIGVKHKVVTGGDAEIRRHIHPTPVVHPLLFCQTLTGTTMTGYRAR
jgi:hypothetical protein